MTKNTKIGLGIVAACGVAGWLLYRRGKKLQAVTGTASPTGPESVTDTIVKGAQSVGNQLAGVGTVTTRDPITSEPIIGNYESPPTFAQRAVSGLYTTK
jgi:hypothetical protein